MITAKKIYHFLLSVFMICFLLAAIGFLLAYIGNKSLGWIIGFTSAIIGTLMIVIFWVVKIFGKHLKFIKFDM